MEELELINVLVKLAGYFCTGFGLGAGAYFCWHCIERAYRIDEERYYKMVRECDHDWEIIEKCKKCEIER